MFMSAVLLSSGFWTSDCGVDDVALLASHQEDDDILIIPVALFVE